LGKSLGDWDYRNRATFDIGDSALNFTSPRLLNFSIFVKAC
jgi:hypothetical protein